MSQATSSDALAARVQLARQRLLFGHVPVASLTAGGFSVLLAVAAAHEHPAGNHGPLHLWVALTCVVALVRTGHALAYLRSSNRDASHWRPAFLAQTLAFGGCWGILPWVLPEGAGREMSSAAVGSVVGIAATGVSMLNVDRISARLWAVIPLVSTALYCLWIGQVLGYFGAVSVSGFLIILWFECSRSHRRTGELLRLRFASEETAQARSAALLEAERLSTAKGRFLATMSHEMRTPLHGILGLARMLQGDVSTQGARQRLGILQGAGQHLLSVINDVLDFSRMDEGLLSLRPQATQLRPLLRQACDLTHVNAIEKGLEVQLASNVPDDLWVLVDADRLRQVLINLLGNAVKFTDVGSITLRVLMSDPAPPPGQTVTLRFEVQDSGVGIPPSEINHIFEAFHQVDSRYERRAAGSGLGLSISQRICAAMQSRIECHSTEGVGSTFHFALRLPVTPSAACSTPALPSLSNQVTSPAPRPLVQAETPPQTSGTVLLVEDNPVNQIVAQAELEKLGVHVVCAENGQQALEWLQSHQADLILMDCHMPELNGFDTTRCIRHTESLTRSHRRTPIVAITATALHEDHGRCIEAGMDAILSKPFSTEQLQQVVQRHLPLGKAAEAVCS